MLAACRSETKQEQTASSSTSVTTTYAATSTETTAAQPPLTATVPPPPPKESPFRITPGLPTTLPRNTPAPTATAPIVNMEEMIARVPRVNPDELKSELDSGKAVVIDVRGPAFFSGHIVGAENIPEAQLPIAIPQLPRDKRIVTYCT
jgi:hypothetical protein